MKRRAWGDPLPEDQHLFKPPPVVVPPPLVPMIVKGEITVRLTFEADMEKLVRRFSDEYADVDLATYGYEAWERPKVFLRELVADNCDIFLGEPDGLRDTSWDDPDVDFRWTESDTAELARRLA